MIGLGPSDSLKLQCTVGSSNLLKEFSRFRGCARRKVGFCPRRPFCRTGETAILRHNGECRTSLRFLGPVLGGCPDGGRVVNTFSRDDRCHTLRLAGTGSPGRTLTILSATLLCSDRGGFLGCAGKMMCRTGERTSSTCCCRGFCRPSVVRCHSFRQRLSNLEDVVLGGRVTLACLHTHCKRRSVVASITATRCAHGARGGACAKHFGCTKQDNSTDSDVRTRRRAPKKINVRMRNR